MLGSNFNREKVPRSDGPIPNVMLAAEEDLLVPMEKKLYFFM